MNTADGACIYVTFVQDHSAYVGPEGCGVGMKIANDLVASG